MGTHRPALRAGALFIALASGALALAWAGRRGVSDVEVVRERHDHWALAAALGEVSSARDVYAPVERGTRAHYYSLVAPGDARVKVEVRRVAPPGGAGRPLRMVLIGPGLTRNPAPAPEATAGDGAVCSRPFGGAAVLDVGIPVRGRYILVVGIPDGREGAYRLRFAGGRRCTPGALVRLPLRLIAVAYLVSPVNAVALTFGGVFALAALLGLQSLARRRPAPVRGSDRGSHGT